MQVRKRLLSPRPLRIAFLTVDLEIGGAQRGLEQLLRRLDRGRFHPLVISLKGEGPLGRSMAAMGVPVASLGMRGWRDIWKLGRLYAILKGFRPDVLQTALVHANVVGRILGRLAGVSRIVSVIHTLEGRAWHYPLERLTWGLADQTIFVSNAVAAHVKRQAGIQGRLCQVIYNGVPEPTGPSGLKKELRSGGPLIVTAARLAAGKGIDDFLQAAVLVLRRFPEARFAIVGRGDQEEELRTLARMLGIEQRVFFLGWRDDVAQALVRCDLFVHPSRLGEGLPMAILEAMAAGVPIIATDVGGTCEAVEDGLTGILVPPGNAVRLAEVMEDLLSDPVRASHMGALGRARVRERFSLDVMVSALTQQWCTAGTFV